jgi:ferredoxin-fold anticodon binding domain-containing protein
VYYHLGNVDEKYWVLSKDVSYSCIYSTRHHMGVISKITLEGGRSFEGSIY